MGEVPIVARATSTARIEKWISELRWKETGAPFSKDAAACRRHIVALTKLLRHPRPDYHLGTGTGKIIGGGGKRVLLGEVEWSDLTKKKAKKAPATSSRKGRDNRPPRSPRS